MVSNSSKFKSFYLAVCNGRMAIFNLTKFHSGCVGKSIRFRGELMTPQEFEREAKSKSKKYKRSIKIEGDTLETFLKKRDIEDPTRKRKCEDGVCNHFD